MLEDFDKSTLTIHALSPEVTAEFDAWVFAGRAPLALARWGCSESARAPVVHGDRAAAERLRRYQLEPSRAGQPALVQGRALAGDPGVDEELVLVDQIEPIQLDPSSRR
jgi:hypothetical protein